MNENGKQQGDDLHEHFVNDMQAQRRGCVLVLVFSVVAWVCLYYFVIRPLL